MKKRKNMLLALLVSASMVASPLASIPVFAEETEVEVEVTETSEEEGTETVEEEIAEEVLADLEAMTDTEEAEVTLEEMNVSPADAPETVVTELTASSLTAMFKAVSGSIEQTGSDIVLRFALSGTGYQDIFVGTYEEANATTSGETIDSSNWVHYTLNEAGKYEFVIPIEEGQTFIPVCGLSASKAAAGEYKWYPRQLTIDYEALTLVSDDYNHTEELALINENTAFPAVSAGLTTVGGPNSNNYRETLQLTMENDDIYAAYIVAEEEDPSNIDIDEDNTFSIPLRANRMGGAVDYDYLEQDITVGFYSEAASAWIYVEMNISKSSGTAVIRSADLEILKEPEDAYGFIGESISFTVEAKNAASYQWYYCKNGVKWYKSTATGATTDSLTLKVSAANAETRYACIITGINGDQLVSEVVMNAQTQLVVHAEASPIAADKTATFTAESSLDDVTYQWYYSKNNGEKWYKSSAAGATTAELTMKVSSVNIGNVYRCVVRLANGRTATSETISFAVPKITAQPETVIEYYGVKTASFSVTIENSENVTYQWFYSKDGGKTWYRSSATGAKTPEVTVSVKAANLTNVYRCVITTNWGYQITSDSAGFGA